MLGTEVDFIETLKFWKSRPSISRTVSSAAVTSASTGLSYSSWRRCLGSEPELTPTRSGVPRARASAMTSATLSGPPMLPGLMRTQCAPASIDFSASVWLKWMSAMIGIGDCSDDRLERLDVLLAGHRDAHDVGARLGDLRNLFHRRREIRGLGLGHGLHRDRRAAADRDGADVNLALRGHARIVRGRR